MLKPISHILNLFLILVFIGAWGSVLYYSKAAPGEPNAATLASTPNIVSTSTEGSVPTPVPNLLATRDAIPDPNWSQLEPGLERRVTHIYDDKNQHVESLYVWRLDQDHFRLDVAFDAKPKTLETWQKETDAALVVNGGYFSINNEKYSADGLLVANGKVSGRSFYGYGGMLAIDESSAELRWLVQKPYNSHEPLQAALQAFPMLVKPGGELGFPSTRENYARARRTVIAQDKDGRILFIVAPQGHFTLHQLSAYLTESDLNLDLAINLDGGGSTGILLANPREVISSKVLLPFVILVYPR